MPKYDLKFETEVTRDFLGKDAEVVRSSSMEGFEPKIGKVRDVYDLKDESLLIVASDRISAFDIVYPDLIPYKGKSLTDVSVFWFKETASNHFIEQINERTIRVKKLKRIDIEFIVRNYLYGSLYREYQKGRRNFGDVILPDGMQLAEKLPQIMFTPTTKAETGHDIEITKKEAVAKGLTNERIWHVSETHCFELFNFYSKVAEKRGLIIPDFKLEFGIEGYWIIQIDEPPTHDSARFWAKQHYKPGQKQEANCLDKEFWRDASRRLGYNGEGEAPRMPQAVINETSKRCVALTEVLKGNARIEDFNLRSVDDIVNSDYDFMMSI